MSRANSLANDPSLAGFSGVMGLSRQPLTPEQQMQAIKRVQAQAEQRVKLGMQLFKAAEARLSGQTDVLQQIKTLQKQLKEQVNQDVAQTLHQYDQWIGQIDESFTTAIRKLEEKIDAVQANVTKSEANMRHMLERAEALLDQSRHLTEHISLKAATSAPVVKPDTAQAPEPEMVKPIDIPSEPVPPTPASQQPIEPPATAKPARNADTDLNFTAPPVTPVVPHVEIPEQSADHEEKIYSKLLQRLIEENKSAEADRNNAATPGDKPDGHADAA